MKKITILFLGICFVFLSACSKSIFKEENHVLHSTLVEVSAEYLGCLIRGDAARLNSQIFWSRYLPSKTQPYSKSEFAAQLALLDARWTKAEHPLANLDLIDIDTEEDEASIVLRRADLAGAPTIKLEMLWSGAGWLISGDNLFGRDGVFGKLEKLSVSDRKREGVIKHKATFWR